MASGVQTPPREPRGRKGEKAMSEPKDASIFTEQANQYVLKQEGLDWEDKEDWEAARKGFIAALDPPLIADADGRPVWDLGVYSFLEEESAPPTVNPSLWRQARLKAL